MNQCFQSVSSGKALVAAAITGKGISTAATASYQVMANNIQSISKGTKMTARISLGGGNGSWYTEASFNISSYNKFNTLTVNDIFVEFYLKLRDVTLSMEKYYNASTGVLTYKWKENNQYWNIAGDQYNLNRDCIVTILK